MIARTAVLLAVALMAAAPLAGASPPDGADAGWPCETEPKPALSPADYWPDAARPSARTWASDPAIIDLAREVARRSLDETEAAARLRQFAAANASGPARGKLAAALVDTIDGERRTIIDGIRRFNARQAQLAKRIEEGYTALDTPGAQMTAERRATLEEQAQWDQRIFEDRQRMLPVVCSRPAALEARLAALIAALKPAGAK